MKTEGTRMQYLQNSTMVLVTVLELFKTMHKKKVQPEQINFGAPIFPINGKIRNNFFLTWAKLKY